MDGLVEIHTEAASMLDCVDASLTRHGAPAEHRIWPLLRRRGLLPGDAVASVVAWTPGPLLERALLLRVHRERCLEVDGMLQGRSDWEGAAGDVFEARLSTTRNEHDAFTMNTATMADYLEDLADWIARGRVRLAHRLATVLVSAQSVTLKVGGATDVQAPTARADAAADIGAELLADVDQFWAGALELSHGWSGRLRLETTLAAEPPIADGILSVEL